MVTHILHVAMHVIIKDEVSTVLHCMEDAPQASLEVTSHIGLSMIVKIQTRLAFF